MDQLDQVLSTDINRPFSPIISDFNLDQLVEQAEKLHRTGHTQKAKNIFRHILSRARTYEYCLSFARILFDDQEWLECLKMIEFSLIARGNQLKGLHSLYRMQGCCFTQLGNWEKAEDSFYSALNHPGEVDVVLVNLGTLDIQRKQWESATQSFREAVKLNAGNDKAWVGLALCHRFKGDHQLALANLEKALDVNAANETALGLLLSWYSDQHLDVLFDRLRAYILAEGGSPQLWLAFIDAAKRTGHVNIARLELERLRLTNTDFLPAFQYRV